MKIRKRPTIAIALAATAVLVLIAGTTVAVLWARDSSDLTLDLNLPELTERGVGGDNGYGSEWTPEVVNHTKKTIKNVSLTIDLKGPLVDEDGTKQPVLWIEDEVDDWRADDGIEPADYVETCGKTRSGQVNCKLDLKPGKNKVDLLLNTDQGVKKGMEFGFNGKLTRDGKTLTTVDQSLTAKPFKYKGDFAIDGVPKEVDSQPAGWNFTITNNETNEADVFITAGIECAPDNDVPEAQLGLELEPPDDGSWHDSYDGGPPYTTDDAVTIASGESQTFNWQIHADDDLTANDTMCPASMTMWAEDRDGFPFAEASVSTKAKYVG